MDVMMMWKQKINVSILKCPQIRWITTQHVDTTRRPVMIQPVPFTSEAKLPPGKSDILSLSVKWRNGGPWNVEPQPDRIHDGNNMRYAATVMHTAPNTSMERMKVGVWLQPALFWYSDFQARSRLTASTTSLSSMRNSFSSAKCSLVTLFR